MKDTILSILRHLLTAGGAYLVTKGFISDSASQEVVGALVGLIGAVWGPVDEYFAAKKNSSTNVG